MKRVELTKWEIDFLRKMINDLIARNKEKQRDLSMDPLLPEKTEEKRARSIAQHQAEVEKILLLRLRKKF